MINRIGISFAAVSWLIGIGCSGPWKPMDGVTPWAGPGMAAHPICRVVEKPFFIVAAPDATLDIRWVDTHGTKYIPMRVMTKIEVYLQRSGATRNWPLTGSYKGRLNAQSSDDAGERLAPFDFTIVSIDPIIVLMTPHPLNPDPRRSRLERASGLDEQAVLPAISLANPFHYGTRLTYQEKLLWFSPDLEKGPMEAETKSPNERLVPLPHGRLWITRDEGYWVVSRE